MFCPKCGAQNPKDARFCGECGCEIQKELQKEQAVSGNKKEGLAKNEKTLMIGLSVVIVVVMIFVVWQIAGGEDRTDNSSESAKTTTEVTTQEQTEIETTAETETTETTEEEENRDLPSIISQSGANYNNVLDLDDYETFYAGDYSFGYPKELYKNVVQIGDSYEFQSDTYNHLTYRREKLDTETTIKKKLKSLYSEIRKNLTERNEILYKEDGGVFIIAGRQKNDASQSAYYLTRIENGYIYSMVVGYRHTADKTEDKKQNYYVDTMYRMCSFARGSYKPRTYQQFLNDDMGTKK